jgi:hypothetical protein
MKQPDAAQWYQAALEQLRSHKENNTVDLEEATTTSQGDQGKIDLHQKETWEKI